MAFYPVLVENLVVWEHLKVLAIDDSQDILLLLDTWLSGAGYDTVLATTAKDGLPIISAGNIDVLLTDILMPDMDGIEVIRYLRSRHPDLWIVAISGGGTYLTANTALCLSHELGADRILKKPFSKTELLSVIRRAGSCSTGLKPIPMP